MIENTISIDNANTALQQDSLQTDETVHTEDTVQADAAMQNDAETDSGTVPQENGTEAGEENTNSDQQTFTLKIYGSTVQLPQEKLVEAAQKGLAFDEVKQKLAAAKNDPRLKALDSLARYSGKDAGSLVADMTAEIMTAQLCEKYGSLEDAPKEEIGRIISAQHSIVQDFANAAQQHKIENGRAQLQEFLHHNPGCTHIPPQVITAAQQGQNLSLAYSQYQTQQLAQRLEAAEKELEILKSRKKAKEKSMPSMEGGGAYSQPKSIYGMMKSLW